MKQVRELADTQAWIVLNKKGEEVAHVHSRHGSGGAVQVDVWSRKPGDKFLSLTHQRKAGGYGYDKRAAALAGAVIEGYVLPNHCGHVEPKGEKLRARLFKEYRADVAAGGGGYEVWRARVAKHGLHFANSQPLNGDRSDRGGHWAFTDLYWRTGLGRLSEIGFRVIQVL